MKKLFKLSLGKFSYAALLTFSLQTLSHSEDRHTFDIPFHQGTYNPAEIEFLTKNLNYEVQKNSWKAYEAKQLVNVKLSNLLPSMNYSTMLYGYTFSMPRQTGPYQMTTFGDVQYIYRGSRPNVSRSEMAFRTGLIASTFLGFLFPTNWYEFYKTGRMYKAEKLSFEAMMANQVSAVKDLYININLIKTILGSYQNNLQEINEFISWIDDVSSLYGFNQIEENYNKLTQFRDELSRQIVIVDKKYKESLATLADVTGIPDEFSKEFDIEALPIPATFNRYTEANKGLYEKIALSSSREIQNLNELVVASQYELGAKRWAWFSPGSYLDTNLGFGYTSYVDMAKAEFRKTIIESSQVLESIRKGIQVAFVSHDSTLDLIEKNGESLDKVKSNIEDMKFKFASGQMSLNQLIENKRAGLEKLFFFEMLILELRHEAYATETKIGRMLWQGDSYQNLQSYIPKHLKKNDWWQREQIISHQSTCYKVLEFSLNNQDLPKGCVRFVNGLVFPKKMGGFTYGEWDINKRGIMKMKLLIDGVDYIAEGRTYHKLWGSEKFGTMFTSIANVLMELIIYDAQGNPIGKLNLDD